MGSCHRKKSKRRAFWLLASAAAFIASTSAIAYSFVNPVIIQNQKDSGYETNFFNFVMLDGTIYYDQTHCLPFGTVTRFCFPKINRGMPCFLRERKIGGIPIPMVWWDEPKDTFASTWSELYRVGSTHGVIFPIWIVSLGSFVCLGALIWKHGLHRRHRPNACVSCRYDLTGNKSGICPECGTPIALAAEVTFPSPCDES